MQFQKFIIKGYRAIEHTEVSISNNLIPIIGVNESGKTTILQAILAFDRMSDTTQRGEHLRYQNRYNLSEKQRATISAEVLVEDEKEIEKIIALLDLDKQDPVTRQLKKLYEAKEPLILTRSFPGKKYSLANIECSKVALNQELAEQIYALLPFVLYFDDFSDRVPTEIVFNLDPADPTKYSAQKINRSDEWHSIIEEVFRRNDSTLADFLAMRSESNKKGLIADLQDALDKEIVSEWKELIRKYGKGFGEESEDLSLELKVVPSEDKLTFQFEVEDRATSKARFFNITERSKGFQWFFNFIMKLKFNPKYLRTQDGAIYLLDEPGSYLHATAQEQLLGKLADISQENTILYCTHSQYLLDPDVVNIAKINIARKSKGSINALPYKSSGFVEDQGALTTLYKALHMKVPYVNSPDLQIISEGITEFYLFKLLQKYGDKLINSKISFVPGSGAKQLSSLISYAVAFSKDYRVLLDSDKEGREAYLLYIKQFGETEVNKKMFKFVLPKQKEDVEFEHHLSPADQKKLVTITGISEVKSAIPVLYYMDEKTQKEFIDNLTDTTLKNFAAVFGVINSAGN